MDREEILEMAHGLLKENLQLKKVNDILWSFIDESDTYEINKLLEEE